MSSPPVSETPEKTRAAATSVCLFFKSPTHNQTHTFVIRRRRSVAVNPAAKGATTVTSRGCRGIGEVTPVQPSSTRHTHLRWPPSHYQQVPVISGFFLLLLLFPRPRSKLKLLCCCCCCCCVVAATAAAVPYYALRALSELSVSVSSERTNDPTSQTTYEPTHWKDQFQSGDVSKPCLSPHLSPTLPPPHPSKGVERVSFFD